MKKNILVVVAFVFGFSLVGCSETETSRVNVQNGDELSDSILGIEAFVKIDTGLYYDSTTGIVYIGNGRNGAYESKTYCPYYAPNGLPYKYNSETNTLEEISWEKEIRETK